MKYAPTFEVVNSWERLPVRCQHLDVCGVAVDPEDRVFLLTRKDAQVLVFDRDGSYLNAWGAGIFTDFPHSLRSGPDGSIFAADDGDHTVRKFTPDGQLLMTLGNPGVASHTGYDEQYWGANTYEGCRSITHGGLPFNKPTQIAIAPSGELYVSDGYANARVHRFSKDGQLLQSWGEPGTGPGQFNIPHGVWVDPDGRVLVADRENERIQIFDGKGVFLEEWTDVQRPTDLFVDRDGLVYVCELGWRKGDRSFRRGFKEEALPGRVSIFDLSGKLLTRLGGPDAFAPGSFCAPHCVCVDSHGDLYVAEVTYSFAGKKGLAPANAHTLQKFRRQ